MKKILIIIGAILFSCAAAVMVWVYVGADTGYEVHIYHFNTRTNQLEPERRIVSRDAQDEMVRAVIRMLYETPRNSDLRQTIPEDLLFVGEVRIDSAGIMTVSFPPKYNDMPPYEEGLFRASLVHTMTGLPFIGIEGVRILVDGEELIDPFGESFGTQTQEVVLVSPDIMPRMMTTRTFTLYFVNADVDGLVSEERTLEVPSLAVEHTIVAELIEGPQVEDGRMSAIPAETRIRDVRTVGGICSINLSAAFIDNFSGHQTLAELTLQSIVRSIKENQHNVNSVQFLIESERRESFNGVPYFDTLFEREELE